MWSWAVRQAAGRAGADDRRPGGRRGARCEEVRCVFGIPGPRTTSSGTPSRPTASPYLLVAHEASASVMADASARATGEVGVFCVVPGPGLTNAMTGIGEALYDSVPIVGHHHRRRPGARRPIGQVHGLPNAALVRPIVKAVIEVRHQAEIPGAIFQAFRVARAGRAGPGRRPDPVPALHGGLGLRPAGAAPLPRSIRRGRLSPQVARPPARPSAPGRDLRRAGLRRCRPVADRRRRDAPGAGGHLGQRQGCIPDAHPLAVGWGYGKQGTRAAEAAFKDVDLVLAIGVRYSEVSTANYAIPQHDTLIHVDINPQNLGRNVPAHVCLCADARVFLDRLMADAPGHPPRPLSAALAEDSRASAGRPLRGSDGRGFQTASTRCSSWASCAAALGPEELIFVDVTASTHWAAEAIEVQGPRRYFTPADNQSMGWAIPAAIGAQLVRPDRQVVCVTGDGCFLMSAMEMSSAARAGLPVKFFVFDDGAYHYMQMLQEPVFRRTTATEIARIDYRGVRQGCGSRIQPDCLQRRCLTWASSAR